MNDQNIQEMISKGEHSRAEPLIRERLKLKPEDPDAHYLLGVLLYFQGRVGQAVESLRKAMSIDPRHTDAAICLSVLYNDVGRYEDAKRVFEKANQSVARKKIGDDLAVDRKFAVKHLELADLYFRYRRYDEAVEEYGRAALLDPSATEIRIRRAKAFAKKGFVTRAIQELEQLKSERAEIAIRIQLGLLHYSQGNVLDAELEWEAAAQEAPENREVQAYLEMARQARARPPEARGP